VDSRTTLQAGFTKRTIHKGLLARRCFYGDMAKAEVLLHLERAFATTEFAAENAEEDVLEEQLHAMRCGDGYRTEDQVRCPRQSVVFMNSFMPGNDLKRDAGRESCQDLRKRR
jgi:hypothetical protein